MPVNNDAENVGTWAGNPFSSFHDNTNNLFYNSE